MQRLVALGVLVLAALTAFVGFAPPVAAEAGARFRVTVDRQVVLAGERVVLRGSSKVRCDWVVEWDGHRRHKVAKKVVVRFKAPQVTRPTRVPVQVRCFYRLPQRLVHQPVVTTSDARSSLVVRIPPSRSRTVRVKVLPVIRVAPAEAQALPATGGPSLGVLVGGVAALLIGAVCAVRGSRPHEVESVAVLDLEPLG